MPVPVDPKTLDQFRAKQRAEVERLRRSFRLFAKRCGIVLAVITFVLFSFFAANRYRLTHYPTSLSHKSSIYRACEILAGQAASSSASRERLKAVMLKLRDGWPGFIADGYYPYRYAPEHLLSSVYWMVAGNAARADAQGKAELLKLLDETRPLPPNKEAWGGFKNAVDEHGLKFDYPELR